MVFKTTCVGSIPATLVIANFSSTIVKKINIKSPGIKATSDTLSPFKNTNPRLVKQNFKYRSLINSQHHNPNHSITTQQSLVLPNNISRTIESSFSTTRLHRVEQSYSGRTVLNHSSKFEAGRSTLSTSLSIPTTYEISKHLNKNKTLSKIKKNHRSTQGWLRTILKSVHYSPHNHATSQKKRSPASNIIFSKNMSLMYSKQKNISRLALKYARSRTKVAEHARLYEITSGSRYAMAFQKKSPLTPSHYYDSSNL